MLPYKKNWFTYKWSQLVNLSNIAKWESETCVHRHVYTYASVLFCSCNYTAEYLTILYVITTGTLIVPKALKSVNNLVPQNRTKFYTSE